MFFVQILCRTNEPKPVKKNEEGEGKDGVSKKEMKRMLKKQRKLEQQQQKQTTQSKNNTAYLITDFTL
jgi:hypothetical protein